MVYSGYSTTTIIVSVILPILASIAVAARFKARGTNFLPFGTDDYLILVAWIILTGECMFCIWAATHGGVGAAFSQLDRETFVRLIKSLLAIACVHGTCLAIIKISILLFYKRIFDTPRFCLIANISIGVVACWSVAYLIVSWSLFITTPLSAFWTEPNPKLNYDYGSAMVAYTTLDVSVDVFILCLPVPMIAALQMEPRRKLQLIGIFWLGLFCVVSGGMRMKYTIENKVFNPESPKFTGSITNSFIWSIVEPCTSIIAACLPTLGPLLQKWRRSQSNATTTSPIVSTLSAVTTTTDKSGNTSKDSSSMSERGFFESGEGGVNEAGVESRDPDLELGRLEQETRQSHRAIHVKRTFSVDGS